MADGHSNRAIAQALFLSEATVKTHLVRIYRKLGVDNRAAAVSEAVRRGPTGTHPQRVRPVAFPSCSASNCLPSAFSPSTVNRGTLHIRQHQATSGG